MKHFLLLFLSFCLLSTQAQINIISYPANMYPDSAHAPFYSGIASGDPLEDAIMLWTRITPDNYAPNDTALVQWELASDSNFTQIIQNDLFATDSSRDWTVKVDVRNLSPNTTYYYRFTDEIGNTSPRGRTRTLPTGSLDSLKFAVVSCSNIFHGFYNAYRSISKRTDLNAVIHLGDFIYNNNPEPAPVRVPDPYPENLNETKGQNDWRDRHEYNHMDPDFRLALQKHPWIIIWDNHDIHRTNHPPAMEAWLEWTPVRVDSSEFGKLYRTFEFGDLAELFMTDIRIYSEIDTLPGGELSFLGNEQKDWFLDELESSTAQWKLFGTQKHFSTWSIKGLGQIIGTTDTVFSTSTWDGYPESRQEIVDFLVQNPIDNIVTIAGDGHVSLIAETAQNPFDSTAYDAATGSGSLLVEMMVPSVTAQNLDERGLSPFIADILAQGSMNVNPHHLFEELVSHGYGTLNIYQDSVEARLWYTDQTQYSNKDSLAGRWVVLDGENHWKREPNTTAISQDHLPEGMSISAVFPNPNSQEKAFLNIQSTQSQSLQFRLMSLEGKEIYTQQKQLVSGENQIELRLEGLSKGIYFIQIAGDELKANRWFVVN